MNEFVGNVTEKVSVDVVSCQCIFSAPVYYGGRKKRSYMYAFLGTDGNYYVWSTQKDIATDVVRVCGTIKNHTYYNGINENWITHCKVVHAE